MREGGLATGAALGRFPAKGCRGDEIPPPQDTVKSRGRAVGGNSPPEKELQGEAQPLSGMWRQDGWAPKRGRCLRFSSDAAKGTSSHAEQVGSREGPEEDGRRPTSPLFQQTPTSPTRMDKLQ